MAPVLAPRHRISPGSCCARKSITSSFVISSTLQLSLTPRISFFHTLPSMAARSSESRKHWVNLSLRWSSRNPFINDSTSRVVLSYIFCSMSPTAMICIPGLRSFIICKSSASSCSISWYSSMIRIS